MHFIRRVNFALLALAVYALPASLGAATIISQTYAGGFPATITGTLPNQGTALEETFTLPAVTNLIVFTTSYATGGFQPNVTLFNSAGNYVAGSVTPGTSPVAQSDPATAMALDGYLTDHAVAAGQYTISLTDWQLNQSITATNLSDGFASNYGDGIHFIDQGGNTRTGAYSFTVQLSQTPEPATLWLVAPCFLVFGLVARRRKFAEKRIN